MLLPDDYASMFKSKKPFLFKFKIISGNQNYNTICWYKVYGYWKQKGDWFWRPLGLVMEKGSQGKVKPGMDAVFMQQTQELFMEKLRNGTLTLRPFEPKNTKVRTVPVDKILEDLMRYK